MLTTSSFTKGNVRAMVAQLLDDPNNQHWSSTYLDLLITAIYDETWAEMLDANPELSTTTATVSAANITSPGYVTVGTTTGLTSLRARQILEVQRAGQTYYEARPEHIVYDGTSIRAHALQGDYAYFVRGLQIYLLPLSTTDDIRIRFSVLPPRFTGLSTDNTVITWPDGHEAALLFKAAASAMAKGDQEDPKTLLYLADESRKALFNTIRKNSKGPITPLLKGDPTQWGGE